MDAKEYVRQHMIRLEAGGLRFERDALVDGPHGLAYPALFFACWRVAMEELGGEVQYRSPTRLDAPESAIVFERSNYEPKRQR